MQQSRRHSFLWRCDIWYICIQKCHNAVDYATPDDIEKDVKRFIQLTARSQWKRTRFANEFIILPFNIAPDDGLRWPCLQAPFRRAVDEMA